MPRIELEIPIIPPSLNKLLKMHWAVRGRLKKRMAVEVFHALASQYGSPLPPRATQPRHLSITVRHSGQERDYDNLVGGCKPLVDCLVDQGLLVDDSPVWLTPKPIYGENQAKKLSTIIVIEWEKGGAA